MKIKKDYFLNIEFEQRKSTLDKYLRNVHWGIDTKDNIKIIGSKTQYFHLDFDLKKNVEAFGVPFSHRNVKNFHKSFKNYDLCFEDSWSLYFLMEIIKKHKLKKLGILHIDDHLDLMSPLIDFQEDKFYNLVSKKIIQLENSRDVKKAIKSSAVGIGNFFAPLFYYLEKIDFKHLSNNNIKIDYNILKNKRDLPFSDGLQAIDLKFDKNKKGNYKYTSSKSISELFDESSNLKFVVHIDLDYFINSYDGGNRVLLNSEESFEWGNALNKIESINNFLKENNLSPLRWIISTSPGFCPSKFWRPLILKINEIINQKYQ